MARAFSQKVPFLPSLLSPLKSYELYRTLPKIRRLKDRLIERNLNPLIEIDGGVGLQNAEELLKAGANVLVAGNSVFAAKDPEATIAQLKAIGEEVYKF